MIPVHLTCESEEIGPAEREADGLGHRPAIKLNVPVIWVNRHGEKLESRKAPDATVKNLRDAAAKLGAK